RRHDAFLTRRADLGHFDQTLWNTLHGNFLVRTDLGRQMLSFTDHVEPILAPLSLIYLVWEDVRMLLLFQSVALALGALPVYLLARDELAGAGSSPNTARAAGLGLAAVYLMFPGLQAANLTEFHATTLVVTPMLLALYYARRGHYGRMWVWAVVVMMVKEEMPLLTLMLGLWLALGPRARRHGLALAAVSLAWWAVAVFLITPRYAPIEYGGDQSVHFERYAAFGDSPGEIVRTIITRPGLVWETVGEPDRVRYLLGLFASGGLLLPLLAPEILLLGAPILAFNVLSSFEAMYADTYHYTAPIVPFFVAAAAVGLARVARLAGPRRREVTVTAAMAVVLAGSLVYHRAHGYTPLARNLEWPEVTAHHRLIESRFAPQIPPDAVLSATAPLFPHVDHRERILQFPRVQDATWVLLDAASYAEMHPARLRDEYQALIDHGEWCIVDAADGYVLIERREGVAAGCVRDLPDAFYDFARVDDPQPQVSLDAEFPGGLHLLGYDVTSEPQFRRIGLRLYWKWTGDEPDGSPWPAVKLYPFWIGEGGDVVETTDERPLIEPIWYPPERWQRGEVVRTEMMPWEIGETFRLGVAVLDGAGRRLPVYPGAAGEPAYPMEGATWLRLGAYRWEGGRVRPVDEAAAPGTSPVPGEAVEFGGMLELAGYDLETTRVRPGDEIEVLLHWHATAPVDRAYTLFAHLVDNAGERVAQHDGPANYYGALPTDLWQPGVALLDRRTFALPPDLTPGTYRLLVGWYDPNTGDRLSLATGSDSLLVTTIEIR
ncbi:MAG: DUF2079 domain-containing protein, partial [Anaerolineae bacterium]|nr:DUF2079 domain-containing protein [Anaerolineae bacterium]